MKYKITISNNIDHSILCWEAIDNILKKDPNVVSHHPLKITNLYSSGDISFDIELADRSYIDDITKKINDIFFVVGLEVETYEGT